MSKNQKKNKIAKNNKNYKIENLEPRLLMDASQGHTIEEWQDEISDFITNSDFWSSDRLKENKDVEGLYCQDEGALKYAHTKDVLNLANEKDFFDDAKEALNKFGQTLLDKLESKFKGDLSDEDYLSLVVTGNEIKNLVCGSSNEVKNEYVVEFCDDGKLTFNVELSKTFDASKNAKKQYKADLYGTPANIQAEFELTKVSNDLEFSFTLDGSVKNGVEFDSTAIMTASFKEVLIEDENDEDILPKYGVLDLSPKGKAGDNYVNIQTSWKYTDSAPSENEATKKNRTSVEDNTIEAKLSFKVDDADKYFVGDHLLSIKENFVYEQEYRKEGSWNHTRISKFDQFTMGKVLEKIQEVSSRLTALQNGEFNKVKGVDEFEENIVDFAGLLSRNAHSLLNLSCMLDSVINNPPTSLQELVERLNSNNDYKSEDVKITIDSNYVSIPFRLKYSAEETDVALCQEFFEKKLGVKVLENQTVTVESGAYLIFDLVVPFANSEKADGDSKLYELGLDSSNEQLATVIGAKALVAEEMDHYYGGYANLDSYASYVAKVYGEKNEIGKVNYCINSNDNTYALYVNMGWGEKGPQEDDDSSTDGEKAANEGKFTLNNFVEMRASTASRGFAFDWNDKCEVVKYNADKKKYRKELNVDGIDSAVSALNAMFAQIDELKDAHATAFDGKIIVSFCADDDVTKDEIAKQLKKFFFKAKADDDDDDKSIIKGSDVFNLINLSEIWVSDELSPAHYDQKTKLSITVGQETCEFDIRAGYFNDVASVSEIASALQEMINTMFHWDNVDSPTQLFVDSYDGKIRFVSLQDFAIDFDDESFAQWLGYDNYGMIVDESSDRHFLMETSSKEAEGLLMKCRIASQKFSDSSKDSRYSDVKNGFSISVTVDGKTEKISIGKGDIASSNRAIDFVELLQEKINKAFKWDDDSCKLFVSSVNDYVRFRSNSEFSIAFTGENYSACALWLGFSDVSYEGKTAVIANMKKFVSKGVNYSTLKEMLGSSDDTVLMEFVFGKASFKLYSDFLKRVDSLEGFAALLNSNFVGMHNASTSYPLVHVDVRDDRLCFSSVSDFSIVFYYSDFALLFGFSSLEMTERFDDPCYSVCESESAAKIQTEQTAKAQTACMEIDADTIGKVEIDLGSLFSDGSLAEVKNCKVSRVLTEIVGALNKKAGKDAYKINGVTIEAIDGYRINSISDINGFTIASLLGLTGEYGDSVDENRKDFSVVASLVDEYIEDSTKKDLNLGDVKDLRVTRISNFNLGITNTIVEGSVKIPVSYGVFGETITGNIAGMGCSTTLQNWSLVRPNELKLKMDENCPYNGGERSLSISMNQTETGKLFVNANELNEDRIVFVEENGKLDSRLDQHTSLNTKNGIFCDAKYSMDNLYTDLYSATCEDWMKTIYNDPQFNLANINLPIYGKNILEIMGLDSKIRELESLLTKDRSCTTVQELVEKITNETGIKTTVKFENEGIVFEFNWSMAVKNKLLELDALNLGREDFKLTGDFKTFLEAELGFSSTVTLKYNAGTGKITPETSSPKFSGYVSLESRSISADIDIGVVRDDKLELETLQVESLSGKESNIFMYATLVDVWGSDTQNVKMSVGGELHVYRYGDYVNSIKITGGDNGGVAGSKAWAGDKNNLSGSFTCTNSSPVTAVKMNDGEFLDSVSKGNVYIDLSKVNLDLKSFNFLDGIRQSVDGMSNAVRRLQSSLNSVVANQGLTKIPFIGSSMLNIGDSVSFLETDFIEPLRKYIYNKTEGFTAATIATKLYTLLGSMIPLSSKEGCLDACSDDNTVWWAQKEFNRYYKGIQFMESQDEAAWHLRLCLDFNLAKDADFDLGFPGLGLKADGGIDVTLNLILDIGFGYSKKDGAYILLSNGYEKSNGSGDSSIVMKESYGSEHVGDDLILKLSFQPKANIEGSLGFLAMTANVKNNETEPIVLGVDLNDGTKHDSNAVDDWKTDKNAKAVIGLKELKSNFSVEANLRGRVDLQMPMTLGIGGYTAEAPHIDTAFNLLWKSDFGKGFGSVEKAGFDSIVFDCGSFVENTVGALTEKINKVIQPIQPLIDFLQSEIPVLNKLPAGKIHITVLDLIKKFGEKKKMNFGFLDDIIEMKGMLDKFSSFINKGLAISPWTLIDGAKDQVSMAYEKALSQVRSGADKAIGEANQFANEVQMFVEGVINNKYKSVKDFIENVYEDPSGLYDAATTLAYRKIVETEAYKTYVEGNVEKFRNCSSDVERAKQFILGKVLEGGNDVVSVVNKCTSVESYVYEKIAQGGEFKTFIDGVATKAGETISDVETYISTEYGSLKGAMEVYIQETQDYVGDFAKNKDAIIKEFVAKQFEGYAERYVNDFLNKNFGFSSAKELYNGYIKKIESIYELVSNVDAGQVVDDAKEKLEKLGNDFLNGSVSNIDSLVTEDFLDQVGIKKEYVNKINAAINGYNTAKDVYNNIDSYVDYGMQLAENKVNQVFDSVSEKWSVGNAYQATSSSSMSMPEFGGSWEFPILESPRTQIMKMLMGGHADLVIFDMRPLQFNFDWQKSFAIIGPLCADVGFSFGADIDLCFGYDTCGVENWAKSGFKNVGALIDGFYVSDFDANGVDINEVVFHSGVVAGASICGRFGVNVGLNLDVNLDFKDPNNDGKIRLTEMAEMLSLNPLNMFDASATISARAYAYLDYFFGRKEWTLWSCAAFDIFKTASKQGDSVATQNGEDLVVNVGDFAENRKVDGDSEDCAETVTVDVTAADKVKVTIETENKKSYSNTYKVKGGTLCIYAGNGDDKITVTGKLADFNVVVYGGSGDDAVDLTGLKLSEGRYAIVMGGAGRDVIKGASTGTNILYGEEGIVSYTPATSKTKKKVSQAAAYVSDDDENTEDIIIGGADGDEKLRTVIFGGDGSDLLIGGSGENYIFGDFGRYIDEGNGLYTVDRHDLFDEGGDDLIYGNSGVDHIYGGAGGDFINGNAGDDEIHGGQGNDVIYGGSGDDAIYGDDGTDVVFGDAPFKADMTIARSDDKNNLGSGESALLPYSLVPHDLKGQKDASGNYISPFFSREGVLDTIKMFDFNKWFWSKNFADIEADSERQTLIADVRELIENGTYAEESPTPGSDTIDGGNGSDVIFGDDGRNPDDLDNESAVSGNDRINGGAGNDFIDGDAGDDTINAGTGNDIVYGGLGDDTLDGGAGNDFVFGDDGWAGYENVGDGTWFNKDGVITDGKAVFGETVDALGKVFGISNNAKSKAQGGDDTIIAGNGSDFVDGQSGDDTYKVQYMGGDNETFTNVMDSGVGSSDKKDDTYDKMMVYGTTADDFVTVSESDVGLGRIALKKYDDAGNTYMERVNFWSAGVSGGLEFISVETGLGQDRVNVYNTSTIMEIDAGADNDSIYVGVLDYGKPSDYVSNSPLDVFDNSVVRTTRGYLSVGAQHALSIKGGSGDDAITVNHTNAALALFGNMGNDTFDMNSYIDPSTQKEIKNLGRISIAGGGGYTEKNTYVDSVNNKVNVYGLSFDCKYFIDVSRLVSQSFDINYNGIANFNLFDDNEGSLFYKTSNALRTHFSVVEKNDERIRHVENYKEFCSGEAEDELKIIFMDEDGNDMSDCPYLDASTGSVSYKVGLSSAPTEKIVVRVMVPDILNDDDLRGAGKISLNGVCNYIDLEFTKSDWQAKTINVTVFPDLLYDANLSTSIIHDVVSSSEIVNSSSVLVWTDMHKSYGSGIYKYDWSGRHRVRGGSSFNGTVNGDVWNDFVDTIHYSVSDCVYSGGSYLLKVKVNAAFNLDPLNIANSVYLRVGNTIVEDFECSQLGDVLLVSWNSKKLDVDTDVCVTYRSCEWDLNRESSLLLSYAHDSFVIQDAGGNDLYTLDYEISLVVDGKNYSLKDSRDSSEDGYFYKIEENRLSVYRNDTGEMVEVTGRITIKSSQIQPYFTDVDYYGAVLEGRVHEITVSTGDILHASGKAGEFIDVCYCYYSPDDIGKKLCLKVMKKNGGDSSEISVRFDDSVVRSRDEEFVVSGSYLKKEKNDLFFYDDEICMVVLRVSCDEDCDLDFYAYTE